MSNINIRELVLTEDGKLKNGFAKLLVREQYLLVEEVIELLQKVVDTNDFSLLKFEMNEMDEENDYTNDINNIDRLLEVLVTDGVCYRGYKDSKWDKGSVVFGNRMAVCNFRGYGFQLSYSMKGGISKRGFYFYTVDEILSTKCNREAKLELLKLYLRISIGDDLVDNNEEELMLYLNWLIDIGDSHIELDEEDLQYSKADITLYRPKDSENPHLPSGLDWSKVSEKDNLVMYKSILDIKVSSGQLVIGDRCILSKEATELFLFCKKLDVTLDGIIRYLYKEDSLYITYK